VKNGALIDLASDRFEAVFTVDRDFGSTYTGAIPLGIVILAAGTTDPTLLRPHMPAVLEALLAVKRGEVRRVPVR
jgi:hypothetical protein